MLELNHRHQNPLEEVCAVNNYIGHFKVTYLLKKKTQIRSQTRSYEKLDQLIFSIIHFTKKNQEMSSERL